MPWDAIHKPKEPGKTIPNLRNYEATCAQFSWSAARSELDGLPDGGLNIAHEAVDRHLKQGRADHPAIRSISKDGTGPQPSRSRRAKQPVRQRLK